MFFLAFPPPETSHGKSRIQVRRPPGSHQSQGLLERGGERVLLHHEDVGRLALHREPVGLAVEAHGTHEVLELGQQVGQLGGGGHREAQAGRLWTGVHRAAARV